MLEAREIFGLLLVNFGINFNFTSVIQLLNQSARVIQQIENTIAAFQLPTCLHTPFGRIPWQRNTIIDITEVQEDLCGCATCYRGLFVGPLMVLRTTVGASRRPIPAPLPAPVPTSWPAAVDVALRAALARSSGAGTTLLESVKVSHSLSAPRGKAPLE
jgi:hypothetical protein